LVPIFLNSLKRGNFTYKDAEYDSEQKNNEDNCGQRVISWLMYAEKYGIKEALKI
jgi:hypothetical protein